MTFHRILRHAALLAGLAKFAAAASPPGPGIPINVTTGRCLVPVSLDGRVATMVLDTGAEMSVMTGAAAARLRLRSDPWISTTLRGATGLLERRADVDVHQALAGGTELFQSRPGIGLTLPVTTADLGGADGLLGGDILRHFTLRLDMPGHRLFLLAAQTLSPTPTEVHLRQFRHTLLLAPVTLDGARLTALVDTGSSATLLNARGLYRLGLASAQMQRDPAAPIQAIGGRSAAREHRFSRLSIGTVSLSDPSVMVVPIPEAAYDLVLGLDILGRQPLLISYSDLTMKLAPAIP